MRAPRLYWCECRPGFPALEPRVCLEAGCEAREVYGVRGDPLPITNGFWAWVREGLEKSLGLGASLASRLAPGGLGVRVKSDAVEVAWLLVYNGGLAGVLEYDWLRGWVFSPRGWLASLLYREKIGNVGVLRVRARRGDVLPWSVFSGEASGEEGSVIVARDEMGRIVVLRVEEQGLRVEHIEAYREDADWPGTGRDWASVYELHWRVRVEHLYREAVEWTSRLLSEHGRGVVRISGGKDSSIAALVFAEAGGRDAIYSDLDWEFEATRRLVDRIAEAVGVSLERVEPSRSCWDLLEVYGPPGRDYRWCTQACKLGPVRRVVRERGYEIVFTGSRALESPTRAREERLSRSRGAGGGLVAAPLYEWTSLDVFTAVWAKRLPLNPLYEEGYERVGCFNCPSQSIPELRLSARLEPEKWSKWVEYLRGYARSRGLPGEWLRYHLWRWRFRPPRRVATAARKLGIRWERLVEKTWVTRVVEAGGEVLSAKLYTEAGRKTSLSEIRLLAPAVGAVWSITPSHIVVKPSRHSMIVFYEGGDVYVESPSLDEMEELAENAVRVVAAAATCTGCLLCVEVCPNDAIRVVEARKPIVDAKKCVACAKCVRVCPLASLALLSERVGLQASIEARMEEFRRGH